MTTPLLCQTLWGLALAQSTKTASYTIDSGATPDAIVYGNFSAAGNITLPAPSVGRVLVVSDISGSAATNNITLVRHGSELINGVAGGFVFAVNNGTMVITSDGTNWVVFASPGPLGQPVVASVALTTGTTTLSAAQYAADIIVFTGTLTGATTVVFPNQLDAWDLDLSVLAGISVTNTLKFQSGSATTTTVSSITSTNTLWRLLARGGNTISLNT